MANKLRALHRRRRRAADNRAILSWRSDPLALLARCVGLPVRSLEPLRLWMNEPGPNWKPVMVDAAHLAEIARHFGVDWVPDEWPEALELPDENDAGEYD